jgi:flavin-dependent dehydrogenase
VTGASSAVRVVGAGPAGSAVATLLARWGHDVVLQAKPLVSAPELGESIPPSTRKLFDVLDVRAGLDAAPFIRSTGNTVWWGSDTPRLESFAAGAHGWQVTSGALAAILRAHAERAGARIEWVRAHSPDAAAEGTVFVVDCTGRAGLFARSRGLRVYDSRYRTVAMVGSWRSDGPYDLPDPSHTLIESYDGGWAWSVPRSLNERFVAVMVDPRNSSALKPGPAETARKPESEAAGLKAGPALYREQLARTRHIARIITRATLTAGPTGWDASMYHATRYVDDNILLVGDAASFLDPLSSAGIQKALASGWLAAVAIHTALKRPAMRQAALDFFGSREAEVYASFRSMTETFFSEAAAAHPHPFWSDRTDESESRPAPQPLEAAFERLRVSSRLQVGRYPGLRIEPRPTVRDTEIVLEPRIVSEDLPAGVRYAFGVDLLAVLELAPAFTSVPDLFAAYNRRHPPVVLPDFLGALATALAHKWLVWL